jgi:hypothetical protein
MKTYSRAGKRISRKEATGRHARDRATGRGKLDSLVVGEMGSVTSQQP